MFTFTKSFFGFFNSPVVLFKFSRGLLEENWWRIELSFNSPVILLKLSRGELEENLWRIHFKGVGGQIEKQTLFQ